MNTTLNHSDLRRLAGGVVALGVIAGSIGGAMARGQSATVLDSAHNLSVSGPGTVRATMEDQVCIFCHTPHNARPIRPLWNRFTPTEAYRIYESPSLDAEVGQPTGASKMCLSCHDGTIALGNVASRPSPIQMSGGLGTLPSGSSNLSTDLSDDHPVSFRFDSSLAAIDEHLLDPALLPREIRLDARGELQCTACHDPHDNSFGRFLVMRNDESQLCISCHQVGPTTIVEHTNCASCHQPHSAPSGPFLLRQTTVTDTCLNCHDGSVAGATDIASELSKSFAHDTRSPVVSADPPQTTIDCADCHEPHTMRAGSAEAPGIHPNFGEIDGMNLSGAPVASTSHEYEVCFKCHADGNAVQSFVARVLPQNNTRLEFSPTAASFHPVAAAGRNPDVPSLLPGWTTADRVACGDCHASDNGGALLTDAGVHGSNFAPLLRARYEVADFTSESAQSYALCYMCHERASILEDRSFPEHRTHIVDQRAPCAACHDAHGIASTQGTSMGNSHLINFATNIVSPDPVTGRLEFRDTGVFSGECFLSCHGVNHSPEVFER